LGRLMGNHSSGPFFPGGTGGKEKGLEGKRFWVESVGRRRGRGLRECQKENIFESVGTAIQNRGRQSQKKKADGEVMETLRRGTGNTMVNDQS